MKSALTFIMQLKVVFMKVEYIDQEIILDVDDFDYDLFDFDKKEDGQVLQSKEMFVFTSIAMGLIIFLFIQNF